MLPPFFRNLLKLDRQISQIDECVTIGRYKISLLLFADDLVLLVFTESGLEHALNGLAAAYNFATMKISTSKTKVFHLLRNPVPCSLQVGGASLKQVEKFKYHGEAFTNDARQDEELDVRSDNANVNRLKTGAIEKDKTL